MQLSRFTDYTLRVLFYVASNNERLCTLAEIASYYEISVEHLRKVVHALSKTGYLDTYRGKKGGIKLALKPSEINIGDIVLQSEGDSPLIDCSGQGCKLTGVCTLEAVLFEARNAFFTVLKNYTLEQLLNNQNLRSQLISGCCNRASIS